MLIKLTPDTIDVIEAITFVRDPSCGAVALFEGDIRSENNGEQVQSLEYEVYETLFHTELGKIFDEASMRWQYHRIAVIQRVGLLQVGDTGVIICVSSAHRREALDALSFIIEEFKKRVPVWKKERTTVSEKWINWTPQL